jgi:hypothetical protein
MQGHGEGFHQCRFAESYVFRDGDQVVGREVDQFAEEAGDASGAHEMHVVAEVGAADAAGFAMAAGDGGLEGKTVAWGDSGYSGAGP